MSTFFYLNLTSALFILVSAGIPILLSFQLSGKIRQLTLILTGFILVHGSYHISVIFGYDFIGAGILDPASVIVLLIFGVYYLSLLKRNSVSSSSGAGKVDRDL